MLFSRSLNSSKFTFDLHRCGNRPSHTNSSSTLKNFSQSYRQRLSRSVCVSIDKSLFICDQTRETPDSRLALCLSTIYLSSVLSKIVLGDMLEFNLGGNGMLSALRHNVMNVLCSYFLTEMCIW